LKQFFDNVKIVGRLYLKQHSFDAFVNITIKPYSSLSM